MKTEELLGLLELLGEEEEKKAEDEALEELIGELLFGEEEKEAEEDEVLDALIKLLAKEEEEKEAEEDEVLDALIKLLAEEEEEKEAEEDEVLDALIKLLAEEEEEKEAEDKVEDLLVNYLIKEAAKKKRKKTYPISRALTSPITGAAAAAPYSAAIPLLLSTKPKSARAILAALAAGAAGAGAGYGSTVLGRFIQARARRGRKARGKGLYRFERD